MISTQIPQVEPENVLSEQEGWALLERMTGMLAGAFDADGGGEAWLRRERGLDAEAAGDRH